MLWIWNSCINNLIKSDIFWLLFAIVLCGDGEEACAILQLCVENLSFRVTKQTEQHRKGKTYNRKQQKKKNEKKTKLMSSARLKIKYPVSRAASIEVCTYSCDNFIRTATATTLCYLFFSYRVLLKPGKRFGECLQLIFIQSLVFILKNNLAFVCSL